MIFYLIQNKRVLDYFIAWKLCVPQSS